MFTLSNTTWVLIKGFFLIKSKAMGFLKVALSSAYNTILESTKKSTFVCFTAVKFKVAHIYAMLFPKFKSSFHFRLIIFFLFNRESDNLYLFSNKFFRKFNSLFRISRDDNFSIHIGKSGCFQIYEITH